MLDSLYENIGYKIKEWAKRIFVVEAIGSVIGGIYLMIALDFDDILSPLLIIILGPAIAFVSTWILYAFGQLVDDVHAIRKKEGSNTKSKSKSEKSNKTDSAKNAEYIDAECPECGNTVMVDLNQESIKCPWCNTILDIEFE